jgi:hypothetical protein
MTNQPRLPRLVVSGDPGNAQMLIRLLAQIAARQATRRRA